MLQRIKSFLVKLNLFQSIPPSTDLITLQRQRLATRLFLLLLTSCITVIFIYLNTTRVINTATITEPTYSQYLALFAKQSDTLVCQCSQISIIYQDFLRTNYRQHQVCTSIFTSDDWINFLQLDQTMANYYYKDDFRSSGISSFQTLRSFCQLTNRTIANHLIRFYANQYVSTTVTGRDTMNRQIQELFNRFISSTASDLQSSLATVRKLTYANAYWSAQMLNFVFLFLPNQIYTNSMSVILSDCDCLVSSACKIGFSFYNVDGTIMHIVPGLYQGCLLTEAFLQSDLRCFYSQMCLSQLQLYINKSTSHTFLPLDSTLPSRFTPTSSVQELMNAMMVETWNLSFSHADYYHQCHPSVCTYTYSDRYNVVYIVTIMFSLVGGLITVLQVLTPKLVIHGQKQLQRCKNRRTNGPADRMSFTQFVIHIHHFVKAFNLFEMVSPSTNEAEIQRQRISTRLYVTLLFASVVVLFSYMVSTPVLSTGTISLPSIAEYENLYSKYSQTITCPCSQISTRYEDFLRIEYIMHDVCKSVFITVTWIEYLIASSAGIQVYTKDFRWSSRFLLSGLRIFCELTNETISDMRNTFYSNQYVTKTLVAKHIFEMQTLEFFNQFISTTTNAFLSSTKNIRSLFQANSILSAVGTQYLIHRSLDDNNIFIQSIAYNNCDCLLSEICIAPSQIFISLYDPVYTIPDMYFGCTTVEALLQSSLTCFYNQTCISTVLSYLSFYPSINVVPLNASALHTHRINSTVQELVNDMMVERWKTSAFYENYYNSCRPIQCSYTYNSKNDVVYVVTTLFGLIGGLVTILRIIIPYSVKSVDLWIGWKKRVHEQYHRQDDTNNRLSIIQNIRLSSRQAFNWAINFNYFPSIPPSTDPTELRKQRINTRLFIVLLIVSLITLLVYHGTVKTTAIITISLPSFDQYSSYYEIYLDRLRCHCSQVNIKYNQFLYVNYSRHPLCQSVFVSYVFRNAFFPAYDNETLIVSDFRTVGTVFFQGLETICDLTNRIILDNLARFYSNQYITGIVSSTGLFHSHIETNFKTFLSSIIADFVNRFETIHDVTYTNSFVSGRLTNFYLAPQPIDGLSGGYWVGTIPQLYDGCDCSFSSKCVGDAKLLNRSNPNNIFVVPGFRIGCYMTEALSQSTLECLFNTTCISIMRLFLLVDETISVSPLNASELRRSSINSTLQKLLDNILVEEWNLTTSFADYYHHCAPSECTYTISVRNDPFYVITAMFGLLGGLVTVLTVLVPKSVEIVFLLIRKYDHRQRTRVAIIQT